jgi:hypothetical protein
MLSWLVEVATQAPLIQDLPLKMVMLSQRRDSTEIAGRVNPSLIAMEILSANDLNTRNLRYRERYEYPG